MGDQISQCKEAFCPIEEEEIEIGVRVQALVAKEWWGPRPLQAGDVGIVIGFKNGNTDWEVQFDGVKGGMNPSEFKVVQKDFPSLESKFFKETIRLGKGGFAEVYRGVRKGQQPRDGYVAIKQFIKDPINMKSQRKQLRTEVALFVRIASCNSPLLLYFEGAFEDAQNFYMVYEYVAGGDFDDKIKEIGTSFVADREQGYTQDFMSAIRSLHSAHIVHRDIKPLNFLVFKSQPGSLESTASGANWRYGRLKLCDFGLARDCSTFPKDGSGKLIVELCDECGTPNYQAPEQLLLKQQGTTYSFPVDLWAAGICLYMLLHAGAHPFAKGDDIDYDKLRQGKVSKAGKHSLMKLTKESPDTDPKEALKELCRSLLNKEADLRPTADEVIRKQLWCPSSDRKRK